MGSRLWVLGAALILSAAFVPLQAQERGAIALGELIDGLGVNVRVLMIGAHPDDEDTNLITWLARGRHVETAYLSLTRGDGGQNIIGNELGEALGVIRTEELLAARRIDGAKQYFTRAFDFGFSKDTIDTYKFWTRDSILGDVVRVVRAFRPHVIIAVFSGTPRDGHGHHQVSGLLARTAYDLAGDTVRFSRAAYGAQWTPLKFYRAARFNAQVGTLSMDVGEYSPLLGRSLGEIAGESRSQHKSQGFGSLQRKGPIIDYVVREATRVNQNVVPASEKSLFDGIDTSWTRFKGTGGSAVDSLAAAFTAARRSFDPYAPERSIAMISRVGVLLGSLCGAGGRNCAGNEAADLATSVRTASGRVQAALRIASGVTLEARSFETWPVNTAMPVLTTLYNRGKDTIAVSGGMSSGATPRPSMTRFVPPGGVLQDTLVAKVDSVFQPWWLMNGRTPGMVLRPGSALPANGSVIYPAAWYIVDLGGHRLGQEITVGAPVEWIFADQVKGEMRRDVVGVPAISVTLDQAVAYVRAGAPVERKIAVRLQATDRDSASEARVTLSLPRGLSADSSTRTVRFISGAATATFRVRGQLAAGEYRIDAAAEMNGQVFSNGYQLIDYDHIRRQRLYRPASVKLSSVDVAVPSALRVAYVSGVGDNIAPTLGQLGVPVTVIPAGGVASADLSSYSTVVIGPRAYEANPQLLAANPKLFDFARKGGVLLVQYGQYEMTQPGAMPYPITLSRPADRVTDETANITIEAPNARELSAPNNITTKDFEGWVQERSLYMPHTFDPAYRPLFSMNDPNEAPNKGGVLIAPLGQGLYIYTSMSFFRQLPAGNAGAARLFLNLMSAKLAPTVTP